MRGKHIRCFFCGWPVEARQLDLPNRSDYWEARCSHSTCALLYYFPATFFVRTSRDVLPEAMAREVRRLNKMGRPAELFEMGDAPVAVDTSHLAAGTPIEQIAGRDEILRQLRSFRERKWQESLSVREWIQKGRRLLDSL